MKPLLMSVLILLGGCAADAPSGDGGAGDGGDNGDGMTQACATCMAPKVCRFGACIDPPVGCTSDDMCQDDSYCEAGECIPYPIGPRGPTDPMCKRLQIIGLFAPRAQCEWKAPPAGDPFPDHKNVLSTPLVVDFNSDNDPITRKPSIVFTTYNCDDGSCGEEPGCYGVIRVIDGKTCAQQFSIGSAGHLIGSVTPALGDLDGDGRADIVTAHQGGGIAGYRYDAAQNKFVEMWGLFSTANAPACHWDSLAIHDLDDDGVPEVLQNGPFPAVYSNQGALIDKSAVDTSYSDMLHPVAADVDGDGSVELLDGREAFRFDKVTKKWVMAAGFGGPSLGHVAIADFGTYGANPALDDRTKLDGIPELAVVSSGAVRVQTLAGRVIFGPLKLPGSPGGSGGAPTVADFDGDGKVEVGVAGATAYTVFDPDVANGILWSQQSQDTSSNVTGSSVFDFDADGRAEVVYADECFSRVYDGRTGDVLFSQFHTSCTWYENPIVADVDGDFRSEVVIPSNANCSVTCPAIDPIHSGVRCDVAADCPGTTQCVRENAGDPYGRCRCTAKADCGAANLDCAPAVAPASTKGNVCRALHPAATDQQGVLVLNDVLDRWVGSRPIWNQHAYAVTGVDDDGRIPKTSAWKPNWKDPKLNNFRQNSPGSLDPQAVPDLTAASDAPPGTHAMLTCDSGTLHLKARVCNRGTGPVGAGMPVSFYEGAQGTGRLICTTQTAGALAPGACEMIGCDWPNAPKNPTDVAVKADDDGMGKSEATECKEANNLGSLLGIFCDQIG